MFADIVQARIAVLRNWLLEHDVTEIALSQRRSGFCAPSAECREALRHFPGRQLRVPKMPEDALKCLGIYDPLALARSDRAAAYCLRVVPGLLDRV